MAKRTKANKEADLWTNTWSAVEGSLTPHQHHDRTAPHEHDDSSVNQYIQKDETSSHLLGTHHR
jgi:hypothetical protein